MIVFENEYGCAWISSAHSYHFSLPAIASDPSLPSSVRCSRSDLQMCRISGSGAKSVWHGPSVTTFSWLRVFCCAGSSLSPPSPRLVLPDTFPSPRPQAAPASLRSPLSPRFPLPEMLILFWLGARERIVSLCKTQHQLKVQVAQPVLSRGYSARVSGIARVRGWSWAFPSFCLS